MWGNGKLLLAAVIIMAFVHKVSFESWFSLVPKTCNIRAPQPHPTPFSHSLYLSLSLSLSLPQFLFLTLFFQATATEKNPQLIETARLAAVPTYFGCRDEALKKFIQSGLLQQELNKSAAFEQVWARSDRCSKVIPRKLKEHSTALTVFQEEDDPLFTEFNKAVEKLSRNTTTYEDQFQFKSFYFLLMDLMTEVPKNQCRTVFMSTEQSVKNGSRVRFATFAKAENDIRQMQDLDDQVLLNITSCFYVEANVCNQNAPILSPAEVFIVEEVTTRTTESDGEYTMIVLKHQSSEKSQNCPMFSR